MKGAIFMFFTPKVFHTHTYTEIINMNLSNLSKQILAAIAGATVSLGATFSLLAPSAQAASFTTEFKNGDGDVVFELDWSGEFGDDGIISGKDGELTGEWTLRDAYGESYSFGSYFLTRYSNFTYSVSTDLNILNIDPITNRITSINLPRVYSYSPQYSFLLSWARYGLEGGHISDPKLGFRFGQGGVLREFENIANWETNRRDEQVSTPEPSLTLGFITLSGLMLGGSIKNRKGKG
ncbi:MULTISPECIES: hypothetical protein [unclassified Okeania]|uniref:hypothetical protein n=1 Tax=unclassified Okeania TaxID=2634635 RepID=UPI00257BEDA3|nr:MULTISPECIES: hypothetical protein [unclassified Okeania]